MGATTTRPSARMFCDIEQPRRHAVRGRPPPGAASATSSAAREQGLHVLRRARDGVLLLRRRRPDAAARAARPRPAYFDLTTADVACDLRQRRSTRSRRWASRWSTVPRGRPEPARDRPALHRRADDGRQRDDVPARRASEVAHRARRARHVHAEAASTARSGLGHAHPPLAVRGRRQRVPRPGRRVRPVEGRPSASSPACCTTPARSPRSPTSWSTPTSGSIVGLRGAGLRVAGPATTARRSCGAARRSGARPSSTRIEFRAPDPACNPYLAFSVMLAAGLKGIEEGYDLPPEAHGNIYELTAEERLAEGIASLPQSLAEALDAMERSELVAEALGEHVFEWFLRNKRARVARLQDAGHASSSSTATCRTLSDSMPHGTPPRLPRPAAAGARADARPRRLPVEGRRRTRPVATQREPDDGWAGAVVVRRRRPRGRVRALPRAAQARHAARAAAAARVAARSSPTSSSATTSSTTSASTPFHPQELEARLEHLFWRTGRGHAPGARRVRRPRAQPRDLPGRASSGQPARPHLHGVRAAEVPRHAPGQGVHPRDAARHGCGATSTTAAPARSTSTSGASGPSSARSTPT